MDIVKFYWLLSQFETCHFKPWLSLIDF